jgi:CBS domain-containing protein
MTAYLVREIVRKDIPVLTPDTPIRRAAAVLVDTRSAAAPVIDDDGGLIGLLSQKDCFRTALHASYHREWKGNVADQMTRSVVTVDIEEEIIRTAEMFLEHAHRVFPVLQSGRVEGLIYRSDVLAFLMQHG